MIEASVFNVINIAIVPRSILIQRVLNLGPWGPPLHEKNTCFVPIFPAEKRWRKTVTNWLNLSTWPVIVSLSTLVVCEKTELLFLQKFLDAFIYFLSCTKTHVHSATSKDELIVVTIQT